MKIQNNYSSLHKCPTFQSKESLKRICIETLNEFNQEFKGIKSPSKLFQDADNAKCDTKKKIYTQLGWICNSKYRRLKAEYYDFLETQFPSYQEKMKKLGELMHKHKTTNCGFGNDYYQYMLAKKGVYSEQTGLEMFNYKPFFSNDKPDKSHLYLKAKESETPESSYAADTWLNTVENGKTYTKHLFQYMNINPKKQYIYVCHPEHKGYREFLAKIQEKRMTEANL